uniref:Uncharacterized protein n=1 Tax=Peronospora matthiolae TaxID=2874970 RepID=A0AAV1U7N9_9STRA
MAQTMHSQPPAAVRIGKDDQPGAHLSGRGDSSFPTVALLRCSQENRVAMA